MGFRIGVLAGIVVGCWALTILAGLVLRSRPGGLAGIRGLLVNVLLAGSSVVTVLALLEAFFYVFMIQTDNFAMTLACREWHRRYAHPLNSLGYRDPEPVPERFRGRRVAAVVGDSMCFGWGINAEDDRFSNVLERKLGPSWEVANIAVPGWSTGQELDAVKNYPVQPELIVLGYFANDIEQVMVAAGKPPVPAPPQPPGWARPLVERSYLVNYFYWRLFKRFAATGLVDTFWNRIEDSYADEALWDAHRRQIEDFVQYTREHEIRLLVVVFFNPYEPHRTDKINREYVLPLFDKLRVEYVDTAPLFRDWELQDVVCNPQDGHYNERVNRVMADAIFRRLVQDGALASR